VKLFFEKGLGRMARKNVLICGFGGCGKSTQVKMLARRFKLKALYTSRLFREMQGFDTKKQGWWESQGLKFGKIRLNNTSLDRALDKRIMEMAKNGGFIMDSWTMPWLMDGKKAIKIWLEASQEIRAKRIAKRNKASLEETIKTTGERDIFNKKMYWQAYEIKFGEDLKPFDLILKTDSLSEKQVLETLSGFLKAVLKKK